MELNDKQLSTLRHMLGINTPDDRVPKPYRNYYAAEPGDKEMADLAIRGAVQLYLKRGGLEFFKCTEEGKIAAIKSHRDIRRTKKQRVYSKFLHVADAVPELTFKDFLVNPDFKRARD